MTTIRRLGADERPAIARLQTASWQSTYRGFLPDAYLDRELPDELASHWTSVEIRAEDAVLVADDGGLVGFIAVWCRPTPLIDNLHVRPGLLGRGIGKALMAGAMKRLVAAGRTTARLHVLEQNRRAVRFYRSLGGEITARASERHQGVDLMMLEMAWTDLNRVAQAAADGVKGMATSSRA